MPGSKEAFELVQYMLIGGNWQKCKDGVYRFSFKPADVTAVMNGLEITGEKTFKLVVGCLSQIERDDLN